MVEVHAIPKVIDSRYRVLELLGEGMTGEVYLVSSPEGRYALKLLKSTHEKALEQDVISAFKFEFLLLKDLRHPNVVRVDEFGFDEKLGRYYFTEEYLPGREISDYAKQLPPEGIAELFIQSIHGLQSLHRSRLLHGDLKPSNLLVVETRSGPVIKLIDFGLADPRFGFTAGTPSTMAPEKIMGDQVDERSDLYSLAVTFYTLFTGENPFSHQDLRLSYQAQLSLRPPLLSQRNPQVPAFWNAIFETLLSKNPANRYRNCEALLEDIDYSRPQGLEGSGRARPWSPERWVERAQPLEESVKKIFAVLEGWSRADDSTPSSSPVFLLSGERGVGKSRTLQEIRFRLQMERLKVFECKLGSPVDCHPPEGFALWLVDDWLRLEDERRAALLRHLSRSRGLPLLLISGLPEEQGRITAEFRSLGREVILISLPAFSLEELEDFLKKITGHQEIPAAFMQGLWSLSRGNPRQVVELLQRIVRQRSLMDPHGAWHLNIFNEDGVDFSWLALEIPQIDQALLALGTEDHVKRAELWLQRGGELTKQGNFGEAEESLTAAEAEIQKIPELDKRVHRRAELWEKRAFLSIRLGHFERAQGLIEKALALLEEVGICDEILAIRLNNSLAWLFCKAGRIERAIEIYAWQQERWESLPAERRAPVCNNELGFAYLLKGDVTKAIATLEKLTRGPSTPCRLKNLYNLAEAYSQAKRYTEAIEKYFLTAEEARFQKNFEFLLRIYNGIGKAYHMQGKAKMGLSYYQRGLELARYLGDLSSAAGIAQNIGSNLADGGDYQAAENYFNLAIKMLKKLPEMNAETKYFHCRVLVEMADLQRKRQSFDQAVGYGHEAHQIAFQENSLEFFRFWVLQTQCRIEKDRGRTASLEKLCAELLSLADDEEKQELCREFFSAPKSGRPGELDPSEDRTRAEQFQASLSEPDYALASN